VKQLENLYCQPSTMRIFLSFSEK